MGMDKGNINNEKGNYLNLSSNNDYLLGVRVVGKSDRVRTKESEIKIDTSGKHKVRLSHVNLCSILLIALTTIIIVVMVALCCEVKNINKEMWGLDIMQSSFDSVKHLKI